jgi:hypothetical protein
MAHQHSLANLGSAQLPSSEGQICSLKLR